MSSDILGKLDAAVPAPLAQFDAFPKIPSTYKSRSESRGFMTLFVALLALLLMLNDIAEYVWGWPDQEFSVDNNQSSWMGINVDITVNMPCRFLSVDLRDAVGDRLMLSGSLRRDGTTFDTSQATKLKAHSQALSVHAAVAQSRKSRGLFSFFRRSKPLFPPTYKHEASADACRVWGSLGVKRVTANLHITTLGHGYASFEHVDHSQMNLSHVISEFSFGPHFPDITQPLDYSYEVTADPFVAYQYFLHVVPTTYIAPRSAPLHTNQYSVTHYTRVLEHNRGTPGIFFKFELDPLALTIHQRTPSLAQLLIRCVGVIGGVFVCMGYAIRITTRAVEVVSGADAAPGIVAAEASGVKVGRGLRGKWGGAELRSRSGKMVRQGGGWVLEGSDGNSPYASYAGTPVSANGFPASPFVNSAGFQHPPPPTPSAVPLPPTPAPGLGFGPPPSATANSHSFGPSPVSVHVRSPSSGLAPPPRTPYTANGTGNGNGALLAAQQQPPSTPGTPGMYATFPPTPGPNGNGFSVGPPPRRTPSAGTPEKDD
ncbi:putative endoplasmic Reticulum-Golgi Intermediate Compartment (ERGIC) [Lyophyllum shimeji]|uniref:Endoplasmic Reticulum-Golgi Intermediate Compartment (ERGIC) n=1 Tax=Lyophyllum shimeji TaxID=47721 RepID=A0A9P3UW36_LYOSH|nr:putative endoplasmic Reticulum-Golgi Intermediate Compartment (ERGIC) [Lyophyllum shimeji]